MKLLSGAAVSYLTKINSTVNKTQAVRAVFGVRDLKSESAK